MQQLDSNGRYGILGASGSGKSNLVFLLLENMRHRKQPMLIIDQKGEYGDLPDIYKARASQIKPKELPFKLRNSNASMVIDIRGAPSPEAWIRDFVNTALSVPRKVPILIVIEEAHNYCPQAAKSPSRRAIGRLAGEGRSHGYGMLLISQRCAKLSKDALAEAQYIYFLKHKWPKDYDYLEEIMGEDRVLKLKNMPRFHVMIGEMEGGVYSEPLPIPEAKRKKSGHTPQAVGVDVNKQALTQQYIGSSPVTARAAGPGEDSYAMIYVGVIIIFVIVGVLGYFIYRGMMSEEKSGGAQWVDPTLTPVPP